MKQPEYIEGQTALDNFKRGMTELFKVPKSAVTNPKDRPKKTTARKTKKGDSGKV